MINTSKRILPCGMRIDITRGPAGAMVTAWRDGEVIAEIQGLSDECDDIWAADAADFLERSLASATSHSRAVRAVSSP